MDIAPHDSTVMQERDPDHDKLLWGATAQWDLFGAELINHRHAYVWQRDTVCHFKSVRTGDVIGRFVPMDFDTTEVTKNKREAKRLFKNIETDLVTIDTVRVL